MKAQYSSRRDNLLWRRIVEFDRRIVAVKLLKLPSAEHPSIIGMFQTREARDGIRGWADKRLLEDGRDLETGAK